MNLATKKSLPAYILILAIVLNFTSILPKAQACGFSIDVVFSYTLHPDFPLSNYAKGSLGIIQPSFARSYLIVAYRYLKGKPLSDQEAQAVCDLWANRLGYDGSADYNADSSSWLETRKLVAGSSKLNYINTNKAINDNESWQTFCNCPPDAFNSAAKTLKERLNSFPADSSQIKDWLKAQDLVFKNCGEPPYGEKPAIYIPEKISEQTLGAYPKLLQKDRDYQIAAANFYAKNYDQAQKLFMEIAKDNDSPYQDICNYLAVRCLVRKASLSNDPNLSKSLYEEAQKTIDLLSKESTYERYGSDYKALSSYIEARLNPLGHLNKISQELEQQITKENIEEYTKCFDLITGYEDYSDKVIDYNKVLPQKDRSELTDWLISFQNNSMGFNEALKKWQDNATMPWLVLAISKATPADLSNVQAKELFNAARAVNSDSRAYLTISSHLVRLDLAKKDNASALTRLNSILNNANNLSPSSLNTFSTQRLHLATNLKDFERYGIQAPACVCYSGGIEEVPDNITEIEKSGICKPNPKMICKEAAYALDKQMPLSKLLQFANSPTLPKPLQKYVLWSLFTRATLIGNTTIANSAAKSLIALDQSKAPLLKAYLEAKDPQSKNFAASFAMLNFSTANPNIGWGLYNDEGEHWWWSAPPSDSYYYYGQNDAKLSCSFISKEELAQATQEVSKLSKVQTAPNYLTQNVLAYAKLFPQDPRIPQALHLAIRATRYGSVDKSTTLLSKQAFQLLHRKYKNSRWTKKTPYWY